MVWLYVVLWTKPSGLYRHRRGLGLHRVGYKGGDLYIQIAKLAFHAKEVPSGHGTKSSILYLHSPTVQPKYIVRLSKDPLIQDSLNCETPSKYYMPQLLTLDKEDNSMIYVCSYSHRRYIVIDPSTCGACPPSLLAKNSAPSRDTTCASKNP